MRPFLLVQGLLGVQLGLFQGVLSNLHHHDDTFAAQAKPRLHVRDVVAREENNADFSCSATKPCPIGCCGAVYVFVPFPP